MMDLTTKYGQYFNDCLEGKLIIPETIKQLCKNIKADLENENCKYYFDAEEANKIIKFIETLKIYQGEKAGENLILEPFQAFFVANLFGWKIKNTGKRRYKRSFFFVGKGNGKTPLMAAIALISLRTNQGGQIYSIATNYKQAYLAFEWCKNYIEQDETLMEKFEVFETVIKNVKKNSYFKPLSKNVFHGTVPSCVIADELASMKDRKALGGIETALHKNPESLLLEITTADYINTQSPGYTEWKHAKRVLKDSSYDDRFLPVIYELDEYDDWKDVSKYRKANPASFVDMEALKEERNKALSDPVKEQDLRIFNLNQWLIGAQNSFIKYDVWINNTKQYEKYKEYLTDEKLKTYISAIGADFSLVKDLTCYTIAYYVPEIEAVYLKHNAYIPETTLDSRTLNENRMYKKWNDEGIITLCKGDFIDFEQVTSDIARDIDFYKPKIFAYDKSFIENAPDAFEIVDKKINTVAILQQKEIMSPISYDFEKLITSGKLINNNTLMDWCIENARVRNYGAYRMLSKDNKDSTDKIDLVISSMLAVYKLQEFVKLDKKQPPKRDYKALSKLLYG